jgi:GR25 family glycosyltransferase involved in LPS biosynthesis
MVIGQMEYIDKIFYINLNQSTDRAQHFVDQCIKHNLPSEKVERYASIDGSTHQFSETELKMFQNASYVKTDHTQKKNIMGNSLSHYNLFCKMIQEGWENIIIFQDDVVLRPNFSHYIELLMPHLPSDAEIVYLGVHKYAYYADFEGFDLYNCEDDEKELTDKRTHVNDFLDLITATSTNIIGGSTFNNPGNGGAATSGGMPGEIIDSVHMTYFEGNAGNKGSTNPSDDTPGGISGLSPEFGTGQASQKNGVAFSAAGLYGANVTCYLI